ncbi:MAG TPA: protein kinase [Micromonosporaceae bacterium]
MTAGRELNGPAQLPPGYEIAPGYQVVEHVRRGEDLDCYEVWSDRRYCLCFVKTLRPDRYDDAHASEHLLHEGRLLLSLTHPHLVRAYELVTGEGQPPVLVLETLAGDTLGYLLDQSVRLAGPELGFLGQHLCSAVRYLHGCGYLHLDVKPSNIIAEYGRAKLIDLSLARRPGRCRGGLGTEGYRAPEQEHGGELGPPTDVWGIGTVLAEASDGQELPDRVARTIEQCRQVDPVRRPTVAALHAALEELTEAEPSPVG